MSAGPVKLGDAQNVVAEISLDRQGLEWLAYALPEKDGFTQDLFSALAQIDREAEEEAADIAEFGQPALRIGYSPRGLFFDVYADHGAAEGST